MKQTIFLITFFLSVFAFGQNSGLISGNLLDIETNNEPLIFAKVLIKETGLETLSDENGFFKFENLKEGKYTLVSSFVGYETKEEKIKVVSNKSTNTKMYLSASTLSLDELMLSLASADKKETSSTLNN
ncbi:carboxypeptidase-like regulatory domain-containing protein [Flaviramulus sp. BrNp1-15]|uniref:carboxypeptidase-like regulatory domain-containing protein n=1 Tax=Flaviramulus sp. BrNp1-15 TaxID=2916754 RepID=UPI001EE9485E|nr:carboxypeptidase-like regulatory domain-containing protein [Flaviramulus sp. BrNp1-15]ULC59496.1 carboxypeptidase-like regulatory domain-containing protein [Flaviramulus sp. BrNp1-15]